MNLMAAYVAGGRGGEVEGLAGKLQVSPSDVFEVAYNVACGMIEIGRFKEAEEMLLLATRCGNFRFRVSGLGFRVSGFGFWVFGFWVSGPHR